ncbi:MAG TPA: hypothetical protein VN376_04145 [Longilinea sp.]|nr:hypothetical protein [Longilinea sp.]
MNDLKIMTIEEISQALSHHGVISHELPMEWELSLPLPTLLPGRPAYTWFACPASRKPGHPLHLSPPDRRFTLDATNARLLLYDTGEWLKPGWQAVTLTPSPKGRAELTTDFQNVVSVLNNAAQALFTRQSPPAGAQAALTNYLNPEMLPWYQALAPDLWQWLE